MNHDRIARILKCPLCSSDMRYSPRALAYVCNGKVLHAFPVKGEIVDFVCAEDGGRQAKVNRAFSRIAGRRYEEIATGATRSARLVNKVLWGTTRFIPLLFEMLESVTEDCEPGFFLDIPVGTGVFTAGEYSRQPNFDFIAADYNRGMLECALEKIRAQDFGNVMLVRADARKLPFIDGSFSGILTMNGICAFPEKGRVLDEFSRLLKPGGKLAGSFYARGERFATDLIAGKLAASFGWFTRPLFTEKEFIEELEKRGFNRIITRKINSILFFSSRKVARV